MLTMRVIVCGGRDYLDQDNVWKTLTDMHLVTPFTVLIHGGATGADAFAASWGERHNVKVEEFRADWHRYGKSAGPKRNGDMIRYGHPDLVIAFPGNDGTADMVDKADRAGIRIKTVS